MPANFIMKMQFFPVSLSLKKFLGFDYIRSTECIGDFNATPTAIRVFYVQRQCPSVPFMREIFGFVRIRFVLYRCTDEGIKKDLRVFVHSITDKGVVVDTGVDEPVFLL